MGLEYSWGGGGAGRMYRKAKKAGLMDLFSRSLALSSRIIYLFVVFSGAFSNFLSHCHRRAKYLSAKIQVIYNNEY